MKIFKFAMVVILLPWTIWKIVTAVVNGSVPNLDDVAALVPIVFIVYSEIDIIYIKVNKIRAYFSANTVSFSPKFQYKTEMDVSLDGIEHDFKKILDDNGYQSLEGESRKNTHQDIFLRVKTPNGIKLEATITLVPENEELSTIILKFEYQVAYRSVNQSWNEFEKFRNQFFSKYSKADDSKLRYDIVIQTNQTNFNPFYRLTVRHIGKKQIEHFNLDFKDGDLTVKSTLHKIYGTSKNSEDIEKMIKEYVPLSKLL